MTYEQVLRKVEIGVARRAVAPDGIISVEMKATQSVSQHPHETPRDFQFRVTHALQLCVNKLASYPTFAVPKKSVPPRELSTEDRARTELRLAKSLLTANPDAARRRLQRIVATYPGTAFSHEAKKLLEQME